jgi:quercetin dioxygenase-like cupin family protein
MSSPTAGPYIIRSAQAEAMAPFGAVTRVHTAVVATGEQVQLLWVKFDPDGTYAMHSHKYEQVSVILSGRMRLTVGEEVAEIGPGDMWFVPANVPHGGELLGDEAVVFIDVYGPPSESILELIAERRRAASSA